MILAKLMVLRKAQRFFQLGADLVETKHPEAPRCSVIRKLAGLGTGSRLGFANSRHLRRLPSFEIRTGHPAAPRRSDLFRGERCFLARSFRPTMDQLRGVVGCRA